MGNRDIITIREHALLEVGSNAANGLDYAQLPESAFKWLCNLNEKFSNSGARLLQVEGRQLLKWNSYVGVVETPCGIQLEILPKHIEGEECIFSSRSLMRKMIQATLSLTPRASSMAKLNTFDAPIGEWIIENFLENVEMLIKKGIRQNYLVAEEEKKYLSGRLNFSDQIRQTVVRKHLFHVYCDFLSPDRPENRLIKAALEKVVVATRSPVSWRLAQEMRLLFSEIPCSKNCESDFGRWSNDRLMAHYAPVKPLCELIIKSHMPLAVSGQTRGLSMLFPMERLFEKYVARWLSKNLIRPFLVEEQCYGKHLCEHNGEGFFKMVPDILIYEDDSKKGITRKLIWIADTKWKKISSYESHKRYGISQTDFYQMYAYGKKYFEKNGDVFIIYPMTKVFSLPLKPFTFDSDLTLHVIPFDLERDVLVGVRERGLPLSFPDVLGTSKA